jgi:hypothetical protein
MGVHAASWHPTVALAVADWLDEVAKAWELLLEYPSAKAEAVARAYLAGEQP